MPDMINPQKGIDIMNNNSIINRILFAVTIFQQFYHNTGRVLISFHIVFLTFYLCFRKVKSDSYKGSTVMTIRAIVLLLLSKEY
jgi:hypothetical protein